MAKARIMSRPRVYPGLAALCFALSLFAAGRAHAAGASADGETCAADAQIVTAAVAHAAKDNAGTYVLAPKSPGTPFAGASKTVTDAVLDGLWRGERASHGLIRSWLANPDTSVATCWSADPAGAPIPLLSQAEADHQLSSPFARDRSVMQMSLPVFNRDRSQAFVYLTIVCPGLCGTETFYVLKKGKAGWVVVGDRLFAIS